MVSGTMVFRHISSSALKTALAAPNPADLSASPILVISGPLYPCAVSTTVSVVPASVIRNL
jgi:hypothetical protein